MIHLRDKAKTLLHVFRKKGFNDVPIFATVEGRDEPEDGESHEQKDERDRDYVCLAIEPQFNYQDHDPYVTLDTEAFYADFTAYLQRVFGSDVEITHRLSCCEFEISRKR